MVRSDRFFGKVSHVRIQVGRSLGEDSRCVEEFKHTEGLSSHEEGGEESSAICGNVATHTHSHLHQAQLKRTRDPVLV